MGAAQGPAPECFPGLSDRGLSKLSPRPGEAMDRYLSGPVPSEDIVRDATTAKEAAWQLLMTPRRPLPTRGRLPAACWRQRRRAARPPRPTCKPTSGRSGWEACLKEKIEDAIATGELQPETDAEALAALVIAVIQGLSSLARDGAPRAKLMVSAEAAMRA